jgi:chromosomal replication initiation ATPase DnaA
MPMMPNNAPCAAIRDVMAAVLNFYPQVTREDLVGPSRQRKYVMPRWLAMSLARELGRKSLPQIGRAFNRDHTTVIHAIRRLKALADNDRDLDMTREILVGRVMAQIERRIDACRSWSVPTASPMPEEIAAP